MPVILYVLFVVSALPIALAWTGSVYRIRQRGHFDNHHPRMQAAQLTGAGARAYAAQANAWESLQIFLVTALIAMATGLELSTLNVPALLFLLFRLLHPIFYIADWAWSRSFSYFGGMLCCLYIIWLALAVPLLQ